MNKILKKIKKFRVLKRQLILALALAIFVTTISYLGIVNKIDYSLADVMYQTEDIYSEDILVVGIDSYSLNEIGTWPWSRDIIADIIMILNSDPEYKPAAIGIDVLYVTENYTWEDDYLVLAASEDNVVLAAGVEFGSEIVFDDDDVPYLNNFAVTDYNIPFEALAEVATYGHVNAMYDTDGVMRHHLWSVDDGNDGEINSFAYELYLKYCDNKGIEADFNPNRSSTGFWWIDYSAKPGGFYACSAVDILYGDYDPYIFKDSIVIIGPYDAALSDEYITSIAHAEYMFGVDYHANVATAMIEGLEKSEVPSYIQNISLFVLTFVCVLIFTNLALSLSWFIVIIFVAVLFGFNIAAYEYLDLVLLPLMPPVAVVLAWIASIVEHYIVARISEKQIKNTFGHYVDPKILKELLKGGQEALNLGGKTVDIAVLFVDIRGFTTMSEKLTPKEVVEILNEYLTLTSNCIKNNQGTLDKFVGDCTMAFWGAPLPCENPMYLACKAAIDMVNGAKPLEERLYKKYGHKVSFGVGVHYGSAVVGNIGAIDRMDYTAIGDTVNTSARLEANAPSGKVYISRIVADNLGNLAETKSLGDTVKLKGKEDGFEVLELLSLKEI